MVKAMTDKKRNVPNLRFRGFTETWEQRKLGEIAKTYSGGTPSISNKKFYINGHIPFIKSGEIGSTRTEQKINYDGLNNSSARLIETGTLLYALYGATSGKAAISPIDGAINQAVLAIIPQNNVNRFIYEWLNKNKSRITGKYLQGGQGNLSAKIIKQINIYITSKNEELKISNILRIVNKIISLNQRKLEQLKLIKKALLQKMFADGKNSFPVIRFSGFTNAWEQRKLGDLGSLKNGMNFSKDKMGIGFPFVNLQDVFGKSIVTKQHLDKAQATDSQLRTYNLFKGDVLFVRSSVKLEGVGQAVVVPSDFINTTYSGFLIRFRDQTNLDNKFKSQIFKTRNIRTQIMSKATDSANKNINQSSLAKLKIVFPSKTEQEKIGKLLEDLDKVITLHQRKLDQLQKLKKSLLQNMFI